MVNMSTLWRRVEACAAPRRTAHDAAAVPRSPVLLPKPRSLVLPEQAGARGTDAESLLLEARAPSGLERSFSMNDADEAVRGV